VNPLTDRGKRFQLFKILCLTVIPILGVWGFTMYSLSDSVESKTDIEVVTTELLIRYRANRNMFSSKHNGILTYIMYTANCMFQSIFYQSNTVKSAYKELIRTMKLCSL